MKSAFWSKQTEDLDFEDIDINLFEMFLTSHPTSFHIKQSYDKASPRLLECKICHSTQFMVGQGNCYTAIKCPNCEWELCIHEG